MANKELEKLKKIKNLKMWRTGKGISQEALARAVGTNKSQIQKLEAGKSISASRKRTSSLSSSAASLRSRLGRTSRSAVRSNIATCKENPRKVKPALLSGAQAKKYRTLSQRERFQYLKERTKGKGIKGAAKSKSMKTLKKAISQSKYKISPMRRRKK